MEDARRFVVGTAVAAGLFALRMLLLGLATLLGRAFGVADTTRANATN